MNRPGRIRGVACLLILAAFGVYLAALTQRSLWLDEGVTLARVTSTWAQVFNNAIPIQGLNIIDEHPPLYYLALKLWMGAAGEGEFALKFLSVLVCVLSVPAACALGKRLGAPAAGLALAAFVAACPGILWQATQLRAYAFAVPLSLMAAYFLWRAFEDVDLRHPRHLIAAFAVIGAGCLTNYFFYAVLGGVFVSLALLILKRDLTRRPFRLSRSSAVVLALSALAAIAFFVIRPSFGGLLQNALDRLRGLSISFNASLFQQLSSGSVFGQNAGDFSGGWLTVAALALAALGWLLPMRGLARGRDVAVLVTLPFLLGVLGLSLVFDGMATYRYVIIAAPAFFLLITRALLALGQRGAPGRLMAFGLGAGLLGLEMFGVVSTLTPSPTWQDDWRSLSQHIHANWQQGDAIVIRDIYTPDQVMKMYLGSLNTPLTPLSQMPEGPPYARRIWLVNTGGEDPAAAKNGLFARWWQTEKVSFGGHTNTLEVRLYETDSPLTAQIPFSATHAPLPAGGAGGGQPLVVAAETRAGSPLALHPDVWLTVYWQRNGANDLGQYSLAVRLVSGGQVWNTAQLPARLDTLPGWGDEFARVAYRILTPVGLPQLPYELQVTLQRGEKNEPVATYIFPADTNTWRIPSHAEALPDQPVWRGPTATLLAAEFEREFHPGDAVPLALTWRKDSPQPDRWDTEMWIKPLLGGAAINQIEKKNGDALAGSPVRAMLSAKIPETAAAGWYRLGVDRITGEGRDSIALGFIRVSDFPIAPLPDAPTRPVTARVGEFDLLGYRLDQPFERRATLSFFTYWKASAQPRRDGVLFLFVLGPDGKLAAQDDNPPEGRSTLTFRAGEQIKQLHRVVLPDGAAPGAYHLYAGIYNRSDIARWEATQNGAPAKDNLVDLGTIELK